MFSALFARDDGGYSDPISIPPSMMATAAFPNNLSQKKAAGFSQRTFSLTMRKVSFCHRQDRCTSGTIMAKRLRLRFLPNGCEWPPSQLPVQVAAAQIRGVWIPVHCATEADARQMHDVPGRPLQRSS